MRKRSASGREAFQALHRKLGSWWLRQKTAARENHRPQPERAAACLVVARLCYDFCPQVAHEDDGVQEPHDEPAPAIVPSLPMAVKSEICRQTLLLSHVGQEMGASASAIDRRASKHVSQSAHLYSYRGMAIPHCQRTRVSMAFLRERSISYLTVSSSSLPSRRYCSRRSFLSRSCSPWAYLATFSAISWGTTMTPSPSATTTSPGRI